MSSQHSFTVLLYLLSILSHITLSGRVQSYDKTEYIIVYIASESSISPNTFKDSFNIFNISLQSILYNTLPTISSSFNISQINIWCIPPDNTNIQPNIYSSFYLKVNFISENKNGINIISTIIDRLNNDLLSQLILNKIKTIAPNSSLIHPKQFTFQSILITTSKNITFISNNDINCVTYLTEIQNKRFQTTETLSNHMEPYTNHDDDDIVQFFVYGINIHWEVFLIWSITFICIGITLCTAVFCIHLRFVETKRIKRKQRRTKIRMERRKHINFLEQTPSCVTSTHISVDPSEDDDDIITIIRPNSAKTNVTDISETDTINYNSNRTRSIQIKRRKKSKSTDRLKYHSVIDSKHKRNKSYSKIKKGSKYDSIPHFDTHFDDEIELKQEELHISNDMNSNIISQHTNSRRNSVETMHTQNTNNTENKVVTVHVHHHYNPNPIQSPVSQKNKHIEIEQKQNEYYPDLPYEKQYYNVINKSPQQPEQLDVNMNNILSVRNNGNSISIKKELSKSQREGFSPMTKQMSRDHSHSKKLKGVRKSIASQPDDQISDSELMYAPGPAADDTPHTIGNTHTPITQTSRDNY